MIITFLVLIWLACGVSSVLIYHISYNDYNDPLHNGIFKFGFYIMLFLFGPFAIYNIINSGKKDEGLG